MRHLFQESVRSHCFIQLCLSENILGNRTPNPCIFHCCMGASGLTLGNRCQICRDILWLPSVPVTFAGQDWDSQKYELIGRSNFHDLLEMVQGLGIILDFYNHEHGCAFKSREKLSINLLKSAEIMVAVCVWHWLVLLCPTPAIPAWVLCVGRWGVAGGKIYFSLHSHVLFHWKWSCF